MFYYMNKTIGFADKIKLIINDEAFKNNITEEKIEIIEKLFELTHDLQNEKKNIIDQLYLLNTNKNKFIENEHDRDEIVLEEITINGQIYYIDFKWNAVLDTAAMLVGIVEKNDDVVNPPIIHFFDENPI